MTSPTRPDDFPGPREGLDNGSLTELAIDGRAVQLDVQRPRPLGGRHRDIDVPDDASALLEGMDAYGS
jgi:hypothetical protein